eukprot:3266959-Pleurochrysis_carterae.AAC.2
MTRLRAAQAMLEEAVVILSTRAEQIKLRGGADDLYPPDQVRDPQSSLPTPRISCGPTSPPLIFLPTHVPR